MTNTLGRIPEKIGNLEILPANEVSWPHLKGDKLYLPKNLQEVHPLLGGTQFLASFARSGSSTGRQNIDIFFFGMDDSPFLSAVSRKKFETFMSLGEAAFYEALQPKQIRILAKNNPHPLLRQGDIWAIKVAEAWNGSGAVPVFYSISPDRPTKETARNENVFNSRHELTGEILFPAHIILERKMKKKIARNGHGGLFNQRAMAVTLARGIVTAPSHPDLDLSQGIYAIARTSGQGSHNRPMD